MAEQLNDDWSSEKGAKLLAGQINQHWCEKGVDANARAVPVVIGRGSHTHQIWTVRSDLRPQIPATKTMRKAA